MNRPNNWDWTYFVVNVSQGTVKIGRSWDVSKRLSSLQTGSSDELCVVLIVPNIGNFSEQALHERFCEYHIRGEWFTYSKEIREYCDNALSLLLKFAGHLAQSSKVGM
jgi:hypothetical protein